MSDHYDAVAPIVCADVLNNDNHDVAISGSGDVSNSDSNNISIPIENTNISNVVNDDVVRAPITCECISMIGHCNAHNDSAVITVYDNVSDVNRDDEPSLL